MGIGEYSEELEKLEEFSLKLEKLKPIKLKEVFVLLPAELEKWKELLVWGATLAKKFEAALVAIGKISEEVTEEMERISRIMQVEIRKTSKSLRELKGRIKLIVIPRENFGEVSKEGFAAVVI